MRLRLGVLAHRVSRLGILAQAHWRSSPLAYFLFTEGMARNYLWVDLTATAHNLVRMAKIGATAGET